MNHTTRKFSRTLSEAFPPKRDSGIEEPGRKSDRSWWVCGVALFVLLLYVCMRVPG